MPNITQKRKSIHQNNVQEFKDLFNYFVDEYDLFYADINSVSGIRSYNTSTTSLYNITDDLIKFSRNELRGIIYLKIKFSNVNLFNEFEEKIRVNFKEQLITLNYNVILYQYAITKKSSVDEDSLRIRFTIFKKIN